MSDFPGPFNPPELTVPLPPPEVGVGSPWAPADGENRDRILDWWRMWFRRVFFPWIQSLVGYLNEWLGDAEAYIIAHAIAGYSTRLTADTLNLTGTTDVQITIGEDVEFRPLIIGDIVIDQTDDSRFGTIVAVIDDTHATVLTIGTIKGSPGHGWWVTVTPIDATGTTDVVLPVETDRIPQINDLVSDTSSALRYGIVTAVIDPTHVTVAPLGVLRGLAGFGWWSTATPITHSGTTAVVLSSGPDRLPQINDLVVDQTASSAYGEIIAVADATHVTVAYVNTLQGPPGIDGGVASVVAGMNITVDNTDPANPIVSATNGGGIVDTIVAGSHVTVDSTDPANPIVSASGEVVSVVAGTNVTVDSTDPANPIVSAAGGGAVDSVVAGSHITVDSTDPANPIVAATGYATPADVAAAVAAHQVDSIVAGTNITVDNTDPDNPVVSSSGGGAPNPDPTSNMTYIVNPTTYEVKSTSGLTGYTVSNGTFRNGSGLPFAALISTAPATDDNAQVFAGIGGQVGMETLTNPGGTIDFGIYVGGGLGVYLSRAPLNLEDVGNISPSIPLVAGALAIQYVGPDLKLVLYDGTNWLVVGP